MPTPRKGEKRSDYIARAIPIIMREGKTSEEATRKANGLFDYHRRPQKGKGKK